jgi:hypothetical protein
MTALILFFKAPLMNQPAGLPSHTHDHHHGHDASHKHDATPTDVAAPRRSVLSWPAWLRVAAVLPVVVTLWLAVLWANEGVALW